MRVESCAISRRVKAMPLVKTRWIQIAKSSDDARGQQMIMFCLFARQLDQQAEKNLCCLERVNNLHALMLVQQVKAANQSHNSEKSNRLNNYFLASR
jgi:hypothetical protein